MVDPQDDIRGLDLVWVDRLERSAVKWLENGTVLVSPVENAEVTIQRTVGANGEQELTVTSERSAKRAVTDLITARKTAAMRKLIDDLETGHYADLLDLDEEEAEKAVDCDE